MEKWVSDIYEAAIAKHKEYGLTDGMAVFYSPIIYKPKILFIGDNPGGGAGIVHREPPEQNYYLTENYELAMFMRRRIFNTDELSSLLSNSVITNRVFFQSRNTSVLKRTGKWREMEHWCLPYIKRIIEEIDPEIILAESITSFNRLIYDLKGRFGDILIRDKGRGLMRSGKIGDKLIIGIKHPTGVQRISYEKWKLVSEKLSEIIAN